MTLINKTAYGNYCKNLCDMMTQMSSDILGDCETYIRSGTCTIQVPLTWHTIHLQNVILNIKYILILHLLIHNLLHNVKYQLQIVTHTKRKL